MQNSILNLFFKRKKAKFEYAVKELIAYSRENAIRLGSDKLNSLHFVLSLENFNILVVNLLKTKGLDFERLAKKLKTDEVHLEPNHQIQLTVEAESVLKKSMNEAINLDKNNVEIIHVILSILKDKNCMAYSDLSTVVNYNEILSIAKLPEELNETK